MQLVQFLMQNPTLTQSGTVQRTPAQGSSGSARKVSGADDPASFYSAMEDARSAAVSETKDKGKSVEKEPEVDDTLDNAPDDELDSEQAALYGAVTQTLIQVTDVSDGEAEDSVISILEGNQSIQTNTDIDPQLQAAQGAESPEAMAGADNEGAAPLIPETELDIEDTARTPQEQGASPAIDASELRKKIQEDGAPGPLENENDQPEAVKASEAEKEDEVKPVQEETEDHKEDADLGSMASKAQTDITPKRIEANQQLDSAAHTSAVTTDELFDAMVERIEVSQLNDMNQMEIQLKPDFLGKVSINLSIGANGLTAKISADDPSVRSMIVGQIHSLIETLNDKGIKVEAIDVVYTGISDQNSNLTQQGGGQAQQQGSGQRTPSAIGAGELSTGQAPQWTGEMNTALDPEVSSVEYRA